MVSREDIDAERRAVIYDKLNTKDLPIWNGDVFTQFRINKVQTRRLTRLRKEVVSFEVQCMRDGILRFDDIINMPNPAQEVFTDYGDPDANPPILPTKVTNPLEAVKQQIIDTVKASTKNFNRVRLHRIGNTDKFFGDTLSVRADASDGVLQSEHSVWSNTQAGSNLVVDTTGTNEVVSASNEFTDSIVTYFGGYDTSSIDVGATIQDYTFTFYASGNPAVGDSQTIECRAYNWGPTLTTADWINYSIATNWTNLPLMASLASGSWSGPSGTANALTSGMEISSINKTGFTYIALNLSRVTGTQPTTENFIRIFTANQTGTTSDPLLVVNHISAGGGILIPNRKLYSANLRR